MVRNRGEIIMGSGHYNTKGLMNGYDRSHKEREALDYYATDPSQVLNILRTLDIDFSNQSILEPSIGGGHMANGIETYLKEKNCTNVTLIGSDIKDRGFKSDNWQLKYGLDFFADDYPNSQADWVVMNPPYSVIEPFVIRTLEIADKGIIMLGRLQFLEGAGRYEKILKDNPPNDVYVYVDRIQCWKNGVEPTGSSAQAYAWFVWRKDETVKNSLIHWIRR